MFRRPWNRTYRRPLSKIKTGLCSENPEQIEFFKVKEFSDTQNRGNMKTFPSSGSAKKSSQLRRLKKILLLKSRKSYSLVKNRNMFPMSANKSYFQPSRNRMPEEAWERSHRHLMRRSRTFQWNNSNDVLKLRSLKNVPKTAEQEGTIVTYLVTLPTNF